mgnify:FL=1
MEKSPIKNDWQIKSLYLIYPKDFKKTTVADIVFSKNSSMCEAAFPHHANALIQKKDRSDQILCLPVPCIASENPRKTNPDPHPSDKKKI